MRTRPNAEASLLLLFDEASHHQLHQTCEIPVWDPVTRERAGTLDQLA